MYVFVGVIAIFFLGCSSALFAYGMKIPNEKERNQVFLAACVCALIASIIIMIACCTFGPH